MGTRLGLDIGTNSIGWALLETDESGQPSGLERAGVRIFSDGRNPKSGDPLAVERRLARGARRNRDRRLRRKKDLMTTLVSLGLMPADAAARKALERLDPYALRARALDEELSSGELGRALFHLSQRRGFKSNRKTDSVDPNEKGKVKSAISDLRARIDQSKARTLGEYLHRRLKKGKRARAQYTDRSMYQEEFEAIVASQRQHHPQLDDESIESLRWCIFRQRPLRPVDPGKCSLNPTEQRAPWALLLSQRFRIYQELNHLRILNAAHQSIPLSREQRDGIFDKLDCKQKLSFKAIRKALGLQADESLNLEAENRKELLGNQTNAALSSPKALGPAWFEIDASMQEKIVHALIDEESEEVLAEKARSEWHLAPDMAERLADVTLPRGYAKLGVTALGQIVPILREQGLSYADAAAEAGYHHSDFRPENLLDELPYYAEILERHVAFGSGDPEDSIEDRLGKIANPTVHVALNQLRKLVNAIAREYGRPDAIVVEFVRDLKMSFEQKKKELERNVKNRDQNERINDELAVLGQAQNYANRQKWKLWEELGDSPLERRCVFSGKQIGASQLFSSAVHVEHILPFSRTYDDSMGNKTLAFDQANHDKGGRTPYEAFGEDALAGYDWHQIQAGAAALPKHKRWRFAADAMQRFGDENQFLARQLTDTAYITRISREYLSFICSDVAAVPGRLTALLRRKWGLNGILSEDPVKNRDDHRTHALDAVVVACTDRGLLQRVSRANEGVRERLVIPGPQGWDAFRQEIEQGVLDLVVSHKPDHGSRSGGGTSGQLHDDTAYGISSGPDPKGYYKLDYRKPIGGISASEAGKIKDKALRSRLGEHLKARSSEFKNHAKAMEAFGRENGIRAVRLETTLKNPILIQNTAGESYKAFKGNSNEFLDVHEGNDGKWKGNVVSTFVAHSSQPLEPTDLRSPGTKNVMRLHKGDMVAIGEGADRIIYRLVKMSAAGTVTFAEHHEAGNLKERDANEEESFNYLRYSAGRFKALGLRRVSIDLLGRVLDRGPIP